MLNALGNIEIPVICFIDFLHAGERFLFAVHAFEDESEFIEHLFFGDIHGDDFAGAVLELLDGEIEHIFFGVALAEKIHGPKSGVGILSSFLEFGDGFGVVFGEDELFAEFETELEICGISFDAFAGFGDEEFGFFEDPAIEFGVIGGRVLVLISSGGEPIGEFFDLEIELFEVKVAEFSGDCGITAAD